MSKLSQNIVPIPTIAQWYMCFEPQDMFLKCKYKYMVSGYCCWNWIVFIS